MSRLFLIAGALLLAGCVPMGDKKEPVKTLADSLSVGCYTVDLFDPYRLEFPTAGVSKENSKFLGVWKDAAWGGEWCHDLYITEVRPDGSVTLLDAYGPNTNRNYEAQIFKRTAQITNGELKFLTLGGATVTYKLAENGDYLVGRRVDVLGGLDITMLRHDGVPVPPIPPRNPRRS